MKTEKLKVLQDEWAGCTKCDLSKSRTQLVWGKGNLEAKLLIIAEAPGANEDEQGIPFVGKAGKLLDNMLAACKLTLDDVYICNTCLCRPPDNRKPLPEEMDACKLRLDQQIEIVNPEVILTLGATACEVLLGPGPGITKRRGKWEKYNGKDVMPSLHPSYLLRNPSAKELVKEDLRLILIRLGKLTETT